MKYSKELTEAICKSIMGLTGRVGACKQNGISYETFTVWMSSKPEFSEAIKKAERVADDTGREVAIRAIFRDMQKLWAPAAWWLERKYKTEFAKLDLSADYSKLSDAELDYKLESLWRDLAKAGIVKIAGGKEEEGVEKNEALETEASSRKNSKKP